jgi:hypothetical protein
MSNEPQEPVFWEATSGGPAAPEPSIVELGVPPARQPDADRGWQEAGPVVTCIELGLFDESNDTLVVVSTSPRRPWDSMSTDDEALFRRIMEMASAPQDLEPHGYIRSSLVLEMSGHLVTFACVCHGRITVLWSRHGPGILVQARNLPPQDIELVMLPDAGPYVEGLAR